MTGTTIGSYEILDRLGAGAMGEVWRARDRRIQRLVAIKMLPSEVAGDASRRARFEQEARALGALNHPNVVAIYDVGEHDGAAYIVSELVEGESLRTTLDRGPLPARRALEIAAQIADGLAAAHSLGIVHRDLKPENVMTARGGRVKLLDFGLAKQSGPAGHNTATIALSTPGIVMGTVGYMSPEQVRGEPADARSDIFSFGCLFYEMLSGRRAFQGLTGVETMHSILTADPSDLAVDPARIPTAVTTIIHRCLEKRPEDRFQSAADLGFAIRSVLGTPTATIQQPAIAPPRRFRRWLQAGGALFAAAVLVALGFVLRDRTIHHDTPQFHRVTFRKGYVLSARFLPRSRNVVFQASWEGSPPHTYLAIPGSPEARDLELPPDAGLASVSPFQEMALITPPYGDYSSGRLVRSSLAGGQTRPLLDGVLAADWGSDPSSMAVLRHVKGVNRIEYPIGTVLADNIGWPLWMIRVSPDGALVAYAQRTNGTAVALQIVDRNGKRTSFGPVSGQNTTGESANLAWTPDGREIWFRSFDPSEPGIVYAVNLKRERRVALNLPAQVKFYDISRMGDLLLSTGSVQIGVLGMAPGGSAERDLSCLDSGKVIGISDDGSVIAADITGESGGPKGSIYIRRTDGSAAVRVGDGHVYRLSPDGNWISGYTLNSDGSRRFFLLPTGPGEEAPIDTPGIGPTIAYGWLKGEQRYLVGGHLPGKKWQCFAWDATSKTVQPVCPEGVPDGFAYFVSPDRTQVLSKGPQGGWFLYPIEGGPAREVHGIGSDYVVGWRQDNRSVYVIPPHENQDHMPVSIMDLDTGKRTPWKVIHPVQPVLEIHDLRITPDGRAYAYNYVVAQSDLYIAHEVIPVPGLRPHGGPPPH